MKMCRLAALVAALTVTVAGTASTTERPLDPSQPAPFLATPTTPSLQVPLLYVVDGVRYQRGEIPVLAGDQVFAVRVMKGRAALEKYGPDASYGVVVITTRQAVVPQA